MFAELSYNKESEGEPPKCGEIIGEMCNWKDRNQGMRSELDYESSIRSMFN